MARRRSKAPRSSSRTTGSRASAGKANSGCYLRTIAHVFDLEDAKGLMRAGVEGFMHLARDKEIDDEFLQLLTEHPGVFVTPNLGVTSRGMEAGRPAPAPIPSAVEHRPAQRDPDRDARTVPQALA